MVEKRDHTEIERRWIVKGIGQIDKGPPVEIEQAYLDVPGQLRVRITTMREEDRYEVRDAELTEKTGKGVSRLEENAEISHKAAKMLIKTTPYRIRKTRYTVDGWEIDYFHDKLEGLVLVERELESLNSNVSIPDWMHEPFEVTETLSNQQLAITACHLDEASLSSIGRKSMTIPRIVMTGGPCAGKSSIMEQLRKRGDYLCIPETATILMGQIGITPEVGDAVFQRTLYRVQRSLEEGAAKQAIKQGKRAIILDRGTLDSAAFVNGGLAAYEELCGTKRHIEYANYDATLLLKVPDRQTYDANCHSNPVRRETHAQALDVEKRLETVWCHHPTYKSFGGSWDEKLRWVNDEIETFILKWQGWFGQSHETRT